MLFSNVESHRARRTSPAQYSVPIRSSHKRKLQIVSGWIRNPWGSCVYARRRAIDSPYVSWKVSIQGSANRRLVAIEVNRATDEYDVDESQVIRVENTEGRVTAGLKILEKCGSQSRDHEHFESGYVLHLIFDDPDLSDYYVSVFRIGSSGRDKGIVIA